MIELKAQYSNKSKIKIQHYAIVFSMVWKMLNSVVARGDRVVTRRCHKERLTVVFAEFHFVETPAGSVVCL